ncbi:hypothetical protein GGR56DRAFT_192877 [Xylariaceae sp. FL0804]|nr:hypothetical protein GGR56DRAFT_192877 [Xylariaceae sp. FL0804]
MADAILPTGHMTAPETPDAFHLFPRLPSELRYMIWSFYALPRRPMVYTVNNCLTGDQITYSGHDNSYPASPHTVKNVSQVCQEARTEVLRGRSLTILDDDQTAILHERDNRKFAARRFIYVSWELDVFCFTEPHTRFSWLSPTWTDPHVYNECHIRNIAIEIEWRDLLSGEGAGEGDMRSSPLLGLPSRLLGLLRPFKGASAVRRVSFVVVDRGFARDFEKKKNMASQNGDKAKDMVRCEVSVPLAEWAQNEFGFHPLQRGNEGYALFAPDTRIRSHLEWFFEWFSELRGIRDFTSFKERMERKIQHLLFINFIIRVEKVEIVLDHLGKVGHYLPTEKAK